MTTKKQEIKCPSCQEIISIDDVLTHQIEEDVRQEMREKQLQQEAALKRRQDELELQKIQVQEAKEHLQNEVQKQLDEKLGVEKVRLQERAETEITKAQQLIREQLEKEQTAEKKMLEDQLSQKDKKIQEANEKELELRKEKNALEEEKQNFEIEKQRQLDEERKKMTEEASKKANEEQQYVIAQLKKQLTDATKAKDDLARKLEQGSQQTQGEVLELELEDILRSEFPQDEIAPVPKGVKGADVIQKIMDRSGGSCGQIAWEFKKTKSWSKGWIQKLKDDQRAIKADIAVIVSTVLPDDVEGFAFREGVWVCDTRLIAALAMALRSNLESVAQERSMSVGKNEKMEVLYAYLTGVEFKQRVEAIVEAFSSMDEGLRKERMAYEKIWNEREKQIKKVMNNTIGMYGDLSGLVTLPQIKKLELDEGETQQQISLL